MWKTKTLALYTPPSYVNLERSSVVYTADAPNTVENVTSLPYISRYLARIKFTPITNFLYKDLIVNTFHKQVNDYPRVELTDMKNTGGYTFEDNLYVSTDVDTLYVNMNNEDIYLTIAYEVTNITSAKNIAIFTAPTELTKIYIQNDSSSLPQLATLDFLKQVTFTQETVVTFIYKYKIYDATTKVTSSILNNFVQIEFLKLLIFNHSYRNYDELDLVIHRDRSYKRVFNIDGLNTAFDKVVYPRFFVNKKHVFVMTK